MLLFAGNAYAEKAVVITLWDASVTWRGAWVLDMSYIEGDMVEFGGSSYMALKNHTSGTNNAPPFPDTWDLAAASGRDGVDSTTPEPPSLVSFVVDVTQSAAPYETPVYTVPTGKTFILTDVVGTSSEQFKISMDASVKTSNLGLWFWIGTTQFRNHNYSFRSGLVFDQGGDVIIISRTTNKLDITISGYLHTISN